MDRNVNCMSPISSAKIDKTNRDRGCLIRNEDCFDSRPFQLIENLSTRVDPMTTNFTFCTRRGFIGGLAVGAVAFTTRGAFAEELVRTAAQTEGPFYPDKLPLDTDSDLIILNDALTPAVGTITHLTGKILDSRGEPLRNAVVEIWQCDNNGAYLHSRSDNGGKRDGNFQSFGQVLPGATGEY